MANFRIFIGNNVKAQAKLIMNLSDEAFIELSKHKVHFSLSDKREELDALLILKTDSFLKAYECRRTRVFRVNPSYLYEILSYTDEGDRIFADLVDESLLISVLKVRIYDQVPNQKSTGKLEVRKSASDDMVREETHYDWDATISPEYFEEAVLRTVQNRRPLTITLNGASLTLSSDGEVIRVIEAEGAANMPEVKREIELPLYRYAEHISLACSLMLNDSSYVRVRFPSVAYISLPSPPSVEFHISTILKLCYYFPRLACKILVVLGVLRAVSLKPLLKSISSINSKTAVIKFTNEEVSIWVEDETTNSKALLRITAGYFSSFYCRKSLVVVADLMEIASVVGSINEDDGVWIYVKDVYPITRIGFLIRNSRTRKNVTEEVRAFRSSDTELGHDESLYACKFPMDSGEFRDIVGHSAEIQEPITMTETSKSVTLRTGSTSTIVCERNEAEGDLDEGTSTTLLETQMRLYPHAETLDTACQIVDIVRLRASDGKSLSATPQFLEFSDERFWKLFFYFT